MSRAPFEIDHLFVCTGVGAPEMECVLDAGFSEGSSNRHPGQGTANRRIFFHTTMLEFLWVEDEAEARSAGVRRLGLWERWHRREAGACPFGIGLRLIGDRVAALPFYTWTYQPQYVPMTIQVGINSENYDEPFVFLMPVTRSERVATSGQAGPIQHRAGIRDITSAKISLPSSVRRSEMMQTLEESGVVTFDIAPSARMDITFDDAPAGPSLDCRPRLPLTLSWRTDD